MTGLNRRQMVLTEADVKAIVTEMREQGLSHVCRYDITPEDMNDLMAFVRSFREASVETRKTFRTAAIRLIVWGSILGVVTLLSSRFGWLKPVVRFLTSTPQ